MKSAPARLAALDERLVITYLAVMAPRLLLTLLALLTGLAAQLTPAQARIRAEGASEIGAVAAIARSERAAIARPSAPVRHAQSRWREPRCSLTQLPRDIACAPAVMLRIDRARE